MMTTKNWAFGAMVVAMGVVAAGCAVDPAAAGDGGDEAVGQTSDALASFGASIQSRASNKCLDIPGGSLAQGAAVNQRTCDGNASQRFVVEGVSGLPGFVRIRNTRSNLCVTPTGYAGWSTPRMNLVQAPCSSSQANWTREGASAISGGTRGGFRWAYDSAFCIDVPSGLATDGLQLQAYPCNAGTNQSFEERPLDATAPVVTVSVYYHDAAGNLASEYVTTAPGAHAQSVTVVVPKGSDLSIFRSASDAVGLRELTAGCGKTDTFYADGTSTSSTPAQAPGILSNAPTYTLQSMTRPPLGSSVRLEVIELCAFAVDTSQGRATSPKLTIQRM